MRLPVMPWRWKELAGAAVVAGNQFAEECARLRKRVRELEQEMELHRARVKRLRAEIDRLKRVNAELAAELESKT
jgi:phage shock protein A